MREEMDKNTAIVQCVMAIAGCIAVCFCCVQLNSCTNTEMIQQAEMYHRWDEERERKKKEDREHAATTNYSWRVLGHPVTHTPITKDTK